MLILTRRPGETLIISDNIRVTILDVSGNQIRLGVTAPRDVPVHREEVAERIRAEAANSGLRGVGAPYTHHPGSELSP